MVKELNMHNVIKFSNSRRVSIGLGFNGYTYTVEVKKPGDLIGEGGWVEALQKGVDQLRKVAGILKATDLENFHFNFAQVERQLRVDKTGDDASGTGSDDQPFGSLKGAVAAAGAGDTILVSDKEAEKEGRIL